MKLPPIINQAELARQMWPKISDTAAQARLSRKLNGVSKWKEWEKATFLNCIEGALFDLGEINNEEFFNPTNKAK